MTLKIMVSNVDMWSNSDGDQLENLLTKLNKDGFSNDAIEIMNTSILINAIVPKKIYQITNF